MYSVKKSWKLSDRKEYKVPPAKPKALANMRNANVFRIRRDLRLGGGGGGGGGEGGGFVVVGFSDGGVVGGMGAAPVPGGTDVGGAV